MTQEELIRRRLKGVLPTIRVLGDEFDVLWNSKELVLRADNKIRINLRLLQLTEDGNNYLCYYHVPSKKIVLPDEGVTRLPDDTVMLLIPNGKLLDPVGLARDFGWADTSLVDLYPIQQNLEAKVVPFEQSPCAEKVKENQRNRKGKKWGFGKWRKKGRGL